MIRNLICRLLVATLCPASASTVAAIQTPRPAQGPPRPVPARGSPPWMLQLRSYEEGTQVTRAVLRNGLTVLVQEFRTAPVVAVHAYVRLGSDDALQGGPETLARLLVRDTGGKPGGGALREVRTLGGVVHTATDVDHTSFTIVAPSNQWKRALEIEAAALLEPAFDEAEWRRATEAMSREARLRRDQPELAGRAALVALASPETAPAEPRALPGRAALLELHRSSYVPGRMILVVCGDVLASDVLRESVRLYGKAKGPGERGSGGNSIAGGARTGFRYRALRAEVPLAEVRFGFRAPGFGSDEFAALEVLAALLGRGEASTIPRRLRDQKKVVLAGSADLLASRGESVLELRLETEAANIDRAEIALVTELELLKRGAPSAADLERAVAAVETRFWSSLGTVEERAAALAEFEALGGWRAIHSYLPRLRKIRGADVLRAARKVLAIDAMTLVEVVPARGEERNLAADVVEKTLRDLLGPAVAQEAAARESETVPALKVPEGPPAFRASEVRHPMQMASVYRGPELYVREDHTSPLIDLGIFFPGGRLVETDENAGITRVTLGAMLRGSKETTPGILYPQLELYGARLEPVVEDDYFGIRMVVPSRGVEDALGLVLGMFKSPRLDPDDVAREQRLALAEARRAASRGEGRIERELFAPFAYGRTASAAEASLQTLTAEKVAEWHKTTVQYRKPIIVIVGDTQGTSLARYFVRTFSGSRYEDVKLPEGFPKPLEARRAVTERWGRPASGAAIAFQAPPAGDEDSHALEVVASYLGGAGGRLADELEERQELAASVAVEYRSRLRGGSFVVSLAPLAGKEDKALEAVEAEIRRLWEAPILYKDYRAALHGAVGRYWIAQQSHRAQIDALTRYVLHGAGVEEIANHALRLEAVREEDLSAVARRVLKLDRSVVVRYQGPAAAGSGGPGAAPGLP